MYLVSFEAQGSIHIFPPLELAISILVTSCKSPLNPLTADTSELQDCAVVIRQNSVCKGSTPDGSAGTAWVGQLKAGQAGPRPGC